MKSKFNFLGIFWETIKTVLIVLVGIIIFRFYIIQPFLVLGSSMEPSFYDREYIFINELSYHISSPQRGDVVVFKHPDPACTASVEGSYLYRVFLQGPCTNYIKRVIGLPGETIKIANGEVSIVNSEHPQGFVLPESSYTGSIKLYGNQTVTLRDNEYYVLGDNRTPNGSSDSREWGPLPREFITGKAAFIVTPVPKAGLIRNPKY